MPRWFPGSQTRAVMKEKETVARHLIGHGLDNTQVSVQLRCSTQFVRDVRANMERETVTREGLAGEYHPVRGGRRSN